MPIYEFECLDCQTKFEKSLKIKDMDSVMACPECKSKNTKRIMSIISKGFILGYNAKNGYAKKQKTAL